MDWYARPFDNLSHCANNPAQRLYAHFDLEIAYKYSAVREEADRLWQESINKQDESIATAAAGAVLFIVNAADGGECLAHDTLECIRIILTYIAVCTI